VTDIVDELNFGDDDGPDDMHDATRPRLDPTAVTIRFHEECVIQGERLGLWYELDDETQTVALVVGYALVAEIERDPDIDRLADFLSDLREYLSGDRPGRLGRRRQRKALELTVQALRDEGTL
jgi:hypothetical protein